ncbi:S1C family serine protease [Phytomonospora endophytica]|uniref:Putative serine protease PepD n=1 Tax=Phytomonospora endophytica TaxID=714109 RepID=A0A841FDW6_9ACTN|nr:trypsin-like peptidase domain-containing protein [Phytomonospora endophytica]MBB6033213.1 putative serine protease PepD [Phytomonospora endophytica]GIG65440.1 protease [Phytomonospora endophytica]
MTDGGNAAGAARQNGHAPPPPSGMAPQWPYASQPPAGAYAAPQAHPQHVPAPPTAQFQPQPPTAATVKNAADSPWWASNAASDPWRDPAASAAVVQTAPPAGPPTDPMTAPAPAAAPPPGDRRGALGLVFTVALITALLAGGLGAAIGVLATRGGGGTTTSGGPPVERPVGSVAQVVSTIAPSVVTIMIEGQEGEGNGSGLIISEDGYIITNNHVANPADLHDVELTVVFSDGSSAPAEFKGSSVESDIAVVKVDKSGLPPVTIADSEQLAVGDPVLAVGAPLNLPGTVTMGIISALDRPVVAGESNDSSVTAAIQTDAPINPGNSGGPLFDASGRVIGVNASIATFQNSDGQGGNMGIGFSIPINLAKRLADEIIADGKPSRTVIGIETSETPSPDGVTVKKVVSPGPAASAGIQDGDVITTFNGKHLTDPVELVALVRKYPANTIVEIGFLRDGAEREVSVTLAADEE